MLGGAAVSDALAVETPLHGTWHMVMCTLPSALASSGIIFQVRCLLLWRC